MSVLFIILSLLPLRVLYALMNGVVYPLAYYVVRYRRKVVASNIAVSFPEKTDAERKKIEKDFYHWFCDLLAEIIYGWRVGDEEMRERVVIDNVAEVEAIIREHGSAFVMLGHYGNWEWIADHSKRFSGKDLHTHVIYRRLKSASADKAMCDLRRKRQAEPLEMHSMIRQLMRNKQDGEFHLYDMLSDQKPGKNGLDCYVPFLHQSTPFITGTEQLARRTGFPVFYAEISMPSRGHYFAHVVPIALDPQSTEEGYITREYARLLEQNILRQPHIWLWSHNRFKFSKPLS